MVVVVLASDALDVPVDWEGPDHPRILGPIPAGDPTAVVAVTPLISETAPTDWQWVTQSSLFPRRYPRSVIPLAVVSDEEITYPDPGDREP